MPPKNLPAIGNQSFEELKQSNDHGAEFWSARDLQPLLGYSQWRRFEDTLKRAITSCEQSENNPGHHFAGAGKPITGGKGAVQVAQDYQLSRFACYLIAQNGDPRKPEIAKAQKYFAIAGYKGLYGGLGGDAIKTRKNIPAKEQLLDRMMLRISLTPTLSRLRAREQT